MIVGDDVPVPTVACWAAARAAAGVRDERVAAGPLAGALAEVAARHPAMTALLARSVLLVDGVRVGRDDAVVLVDGAILEVLPPFAGGAR